MKIFLKSLICFLFVISLFSVKNLYAYTVTYDQIIKPSFGPEMKMEVKSKDNLLRIETKVSGQEIITIGNDTGTYSYLPAQNMATKVKRVELKENFIKYPEKYINHIKFLGAKKIGYDFIDDERCDIYTYSDITLNSKVRSYVSTITKLPLKMVIENSFGSSTILFKNIKVGEKIPDSFFQVPAGVQIIDTDAILKQ